MSDAGPATPGSQAPVAEAGLAGAAGHVGSDAGKPASPLEVIADDFMSPEKPLGTFKDPQSTMIAGIEEHVGYVPGWLLILFILAVALAMIMWVPQCAGPTGAGY